MSRYLLLLLLNLPFILAGMLTVVTQYKLGRASGRRLTTQLILWLVILVSLILAEPLYLWLRANGFTQTDSLSLFDVVQITAIVSIAYVANRMRLKLMVVERRLQDLHRELSIQLSTRK